LIIRRQMRDRKRAFTRFLLDLVFVDFKRESNAILTPFVAILNVYFKFPPKNLHRLRIAKSLAIEGS
jgi:hypothetical protein